MPVPAALIAEKPSYSRGPDGKTPYGVASFQQQIVDLHKSTLSSSMMASSAKSAFAAAKDYYAADASHRQIAVVRQDERAYRLAQEKRQAEERQNLAKAFKIEKGRFEAEWAARIEAVEADCVERERVLREVHEIARADCEKGIERKVASLRHRSSSYLLSMEDTQEKLARMHEYKAAGVAARAHRMRDAEEAAFLRVKASQGTRPRQECADTQASEMRNLLQKCHSMRVAVRRERAEAYEVFKQKYRNLEADLEHAHKIEVSLGDTRHEIGAVQSHKSRSTTASTFRGTLKYESLAGTKFDVPAVSTLEPIEGFVPLP